MSQAPVQVLSTTAREENVRIGPISVFALVAIICMAVLAVLAVSTANASLVMTQRLATATEELYLDETAAQTFIAKMDVCLAAARASDAADAGEAGARAVSSQLAELEAAANKAAGGEVDVVASVSSQQVNAEFSCSNGRTLNMVVTILSDGTYRIDKWKMTAVVNQEEPMGQLYTGS